MGTSYLPTTDDALAAWGANASQIITAAPTTLGVTAPMATELAARLAAFTVALAASNAPATRGPARTLVKRQTKSSYVDYVRMVVRQIQGTSTVTDSQRQALGITVPKTHYQPAPPPGTPYKFVATLDTNGALNLGWKCENPRGTSGTVYQVWRTVSGATAPAYLGGTGERKITDSTLPAGTSSVTYAVQAVRSTAAGPWGYYTVNFTVGGQLTPPATLKMAA